MKIEGISWALSPLRSQPAMTLLAAYVAAGAWDVFLGGHAEMLVVVVAAVWALRIHVDVRMPWWSDMRATRHLVERRRNAEGWARIATIKDAATRREILAVYARFAGRPADDDATATLKIALRTPGGDYWRGSDEHLEMEIDAQGRGRLDLTGLVARIHELRMRISIGHEAEVFSVEVLPEGAVATPFSPTPDMEADTAEMEIVRTILATATLTTHKGLDGARRSVAVAVHPDRGPAERRQLRENAMKAANSYLTAKAGTLRA